MIIGLYIGRDGGGWYVEWCKETRRGVVLVQRWYGPRVDVEERAKLPPEGRGWHRADYEGCPPYDHATATGMYDGW